MANKHRGTEFRNTEEVGQGGLPSLIGDTDVDEYRFDRAIGDSNTKRASVSTRAGEDYVDFGTTRYVNIDTGDGHDVVRVRGNANSTNINTGRDHDEVVINGKANGTNILTGHGEDYVQTNALVGKLLVDLGSGRDRLITGDILGNSDTSKVTINGGEGSDIIKANDVKNAEINGGEGWDQVTVNNTDNVIIATGNDRDTITINGNAKNTNIFAGAGSDHVVIKGDIVGTGRVHLGTGNDKLEVSSIENLKKLQVNGGAGTDELVIKESAGDYRYGLDPRTQVLTIYDTQGNTVAALPGFEKVTFMGGAGTQTQSGPGFFHPTEGRVATTLREGVEAVATGAADAATGLPRAFNFASQRGSGRD
jgi:hypothetical protein